MVPLRRCVRARGDSDRPSRSAWVCRDGKENEERARRTCAIYVRIRDDRRAHRATGWEGQGGRGGDSCFAAAGKTSLALALFQDGKGEFLSGIEGPAEGVT